MKLKVISAFRDHDDHVTVYDPETILEVNDKERAKSLIERGLCKEFNGKTEPAYILGEEQGDKLPQKPETETEEPTNTEGDE